MSYKMSYDEDGRLIISGIECACGSQHNEPTQDIYVGSGIIDKTAAYIKKRNYGAHCVLVADNITWDIAGARLSAHLRSAGYAVSECILRRNGRLEPDETAVGEVFLALQPDTDFLVSVGSGSITDTVRVVAARVNLPQVCVGTAPSMDGYTSSICPLTYRGVKIHRPGKCPEIIVCDTDILKTAPMDMVCAGVGDVLGKYIAKADWKIGRIINDEVYCDVCGEIVTDALERLLNNIDEIKARSEKGIRLLTEALLLSGMTIMIIGHTRAVASVEHNIAHYWEMMQMFAGKPAPGHGASVGVSTLLVWPIFKRFANEDLSALDYEAIRKNAPDRAARTVWMKKAYGPAADAIMEENEGDFLSWEEQKRRITRAEARFSEIRRCIDEMPPVSRLEDAMKRLGAPMTPAELGIDTPLLNLSMRCAKDYRTRYTLFKLISECGLEDKYLKDYPIC
ncbi:MAG: sn-glycerol-1-phosphate dehydrogenase [Clostridia bacterium]|nr:sn-glycerol-1-phosphate dehydrogenase [Clostridia bacterium]